MNCQQHILFKIVLIFVTLIYLGEIQAQNNARDKNPVNHAVNAKSPSKWINLIKFTYLKKDLFVKKVMNSRFIHRRDAIYRV